MAVNPESQLTVPKFSTLSIIRSPINTPGGASNQNFLESMITQSDFDNNQHKQSAALIDAHMIRKDGIILKAISQASWSVLLSLKLLKRSVPLKEIGLIRSARSFKLTKQFKERSLSLIRNFQLSWNVWNSTDLSFCVISWK